MRQRPKPKKSVCIISEVGQRFQLKKIGIMVFGNEEKTIAIPAWKLDDKIYAKTKALLSKDFTVRRIPAPYDAFQPLHEEREIFASGPSLPQIVRKVSEGSDCDYYLVIGCGGSRVSSTNQNATGLGVLETSNAFSDYRYIYALTHIQLYDGKSFEILRYARGKTDQGTFLALLHGPFQEIAAKTHGSLQAVADDTKTREIVWAQLDKSLEITLPEVMDMDAVDASAKANAAGKKKDDWAPF